MATVLERRYRALLIANWHYPEDPPNLPDLKSPLNDVSRLAASLGDPLISLFDSADVSTVTERPSYEIGYALEAYFGDAISEDLLLVYFSGYSFVDDRGAMLLCGRNSRSDRRRSTALAVDEIGKLMDTCQAAHTVVILDCCQVGDYIPVDFGAELAGPHRTILGSWRSRSRPADAPHANGLSEFTGHLIDGLRAAEAPPTAGVLSIGGLYEYVRAKIQQRPDSVTCSLIGDRDVPIARRLHTPAGPAHRAHDPDDQIAASLTVSETLIDVGEVELGESLPVERVYVTARTRGGYPAPWAPRSDATWVGLGTYPDRLEITLTPSEGTNRANIEIRNQETGAARTVRVIARVNARRGGTPPAATNAGRLSETTKVEQHASVPARSQVLTLKDKQRLCDALLVLSGMRDQNLRSLYVGELEARLGRSLRLSRYADARHDVWSLVNACLSRPGQLLKLAQILRVFHGDSEPVREVTRLVEQFDAKPEGGLAPAEDGPADPVVDDFVDWASPHNLGDARDGDAPLEASHDQHAKAHAGRRHLADEYFLLGHRIDGRTVVARDIFEAGLAGALFGELVLSGHLTISQGLVKTVDGMPAEELAGFVERIVGELAVPCRALDLVRILQRRCALWVGQRLVNEGLLIRESKRTVTLKSEVRYRPLDLEKVQGPTAHLTSFLVNTDLIPDAHSATLLSLLRSTGLDRALVTELDRKEAQRRIDHILTTYVPPTLRAVVASVDDAIALMTFSSTHR